MIFEMGPVEIHSFNPIQPGGYLAPPLRSFAHNSEREKDNLTKFGVLFLKIYRNLLKGRSLSIDTLLLPWQHFIGGELQKDRVLQNSNDVTVTSFLNQS